MRKGLTEIVFILDRSGSMRGLEKDTVGGYNSLIQKQKKEEGEALISTVLFDDKQEVLHDRRNLWEVEPLTEDDYCVRGCTALLDAIGGAIHHIGNIHKYAREEDRPEKTLFIITTDGMENSSHRYTYDKVKSMIQRQKEKYGWEFLFLGANIDAAAEAQRFGISKERAVDYHADHVGTELNYRVLSEAICRVRKCADADAMDKALCDWDQGFVRTLLDEAENREERCMKMLDVHMHIIPDVDDGPDDLLMAEQMLRMASSQGIEVVFATSHSMAHEKYTEYTRTQYRKLQKLVKEKNLPIKVCLGCEMLYDITRVDQILSDLDSGRIPSLNGTRYVLTELIDGQSNQMLPYLKKLLEKNWIPVISHAERVSDLTFEMIQKMRKAGCLMQINVYSIAEEENEDVKKKARLLLDHKLVDFVGSDAHRLEHRPPAVERGIRYLYEHYEEAYVDDILYNNAYQHLLKETEDIDVPESNIWIDGILGVITGDALGMPIQFVDREEVKKSPIFTMDGFGTYDMPAGTWSDDSSMTLATLVSLVEKKRVNFDDIMYRFYDWAANGKYTPAGISFDQGNTCMEAICNYARDKDYMTCGKIGEWANGNGALMRIMPVCLYAYTQIKQKTMPYDKAIEYVHQVSALTHCHLRSIMACSIYFFLVHAILEYKGTLQAKLQAGITNAKRFYACDSSNLEEWSHYKRLENLKRFALISENEIKSSGYVVDSLEAAVWSLITTSSLEECLLKAVNLGDDTDTVGAIAGGLAGLHYGYQNIPAKWRRSIIKKEEILDWCLKATEVFKS